MKRLGDNLRDHGRVVAVDALIPEVLDEESSPLVESSSEAVVVDKNDGRVANVDDADVEGRHERCDGTLEGLVGNEDGKLLRVRSCRPIRSSAPVPGGVAR